MRATVFIPTYNRAKYLRLCLESLAKQDTEFLIVISDNASSDDTKEVATCFPNLNIEYHRNNANIGITANFNRSLELCTTEYVLLLPDDVLLAPGFIERAVKALDEHNGSMYGASTLITVPKQSAGIFTPLILPASEAWPVELYKWGFTQWSAACLFRCPIYTGTAMFRRAFLKPWPQDMDANADRLTYFEMGQAGTILYEPWIGSYTTYDGHNFGSTLDGEIVKAEYQKVTKYIMDECLKLGVDVVGWWKANIQRFGEQDRREILSQARMSLPSDTYAKVFKPFEIPRFKRAVAKLRQHLRSIIC